PIRHQRSPDTAFANSHRSTDQQVKSRQKVAQVSVVVTQPGRSVWEFEHPWSHALCSCCTDGKQCKYY
ncbi:unnamed protein product, partial [Rotaria socialis]